MEPAITRKYGVHEERHLKIRIQRHSHFIFSIRLYLWRFIQIVVPVQCPQFIVFGQYFELIEYVASLYNCKIEIIDTTKKSEQQELVEDLVQIITVFSCKLQGKRANKARKMVKELIEEGENGDKNIKD